jgi:hypothetical protein
LGTSDPPWGPCPRSPLRVQARAKCNRRTLETASVRRSVGNLGAAGAGLLSRHDSPPESPGTTPWISTRSPSSAPIGTQAKGGILGRAEPPEWYSGSPVRDSPLNIPYNPNLPLPRRRALGLANLRKGASLPLPSQGCEDVRAASGNITLVRSRSEFDSP